MDIITFSETSETHPTKRKRAKFIEIQKKIGGVEGTGTLQVEDAEALC